MDFAACRLYCLAQDGAYEFFPFGNNQTIFKVGSRAFAIFLDTNPSQMNLKCNPDESEVLRAKFPSIIPSYNVNLQHWNNVILDGSVPDDLIRKMIHNSYKLVLMTLTRRERREIWQNA